MPEEKSAIIRTLFLGPKGKYDSYLENDRIRKDVAKIVEPVEIAIPEKEPLNRI